MYKRKCRINIGRKLDNVTDERTIELKSRCGNNLIYPRYTYKGVRFIEINNRHENYRDRVHTKCGSRRKL